MKAIMVMFDSLNRRFLSPYGCDWTHTPNFRRLAERTVTFDNAYVGSMPCMPARRELHTGRYNFLHRSWGPLEPFDDSTPELLKDKGIYTHLATDHYHYWEEGGATYQTRYNSWELARGQEFDLWKGQVADPPMPKEFFGQVRRPNWVNRQHMEREQDMPQAVTFARGLEFLRANAAADNWFLHLETFDPHEPFIVPERFGKLFEDGYAGPHFDWPFYRPMDLPPEAVRHIRNLYAALVAMCDHYLGQVLDLMDEKDLWKDTLLIVNTDHGFMLGEHDWWAKCAMPFWNEVAHTPLFIWDPRTGAAGQHRQALVQTIDLPATLLEYFGLPLPADMEGVPLRETIAADAPVRAAGLYGIHGGHVNVTDGRYVYMRACPGPENAPLFEYTHMPMHMRHTFPVEELRDIQLAEPFPFTKGCRTMKILGRTKYSSHNFGTLLYDLAADPRQERPLQNPRIEAMMLDHLVPLMRANHAPAEQFQRLGIAQ